MAKVIGVKKTQTVFSIEVSDTEVRALIKILGATSVSSAIDNGCTSNQANSIQNIYDVLEIAQNENL